MLIIIDKKLPEQAKQRLKDYGELYELESTNIVYSAISGHPDIFIFQNDTKLIVAPNTPISLIEKLESNEINFEFGSENLGEKYPQTSVYNVAYGNGVFIGNNRYCDRKILELSEGKKWIQSKQSYARCNTLILDSDSIITSEKSLKKDFNNTLIINNNEILLPEFDYGFIGGCAGIYKKEIFFTGSLNKHSQGNDIREFCKQKGYTIVELSDGKLMDIGGIFFI